MAQQSCAPLPAVSPEASVLPSSAAGKAEEQGRAMRILQRLLHLLLALWHTVLDFLDEVFKLGIGTMWTALYELYLLSLKPGQSFCFLERDQS